MPFAIGPQHLAENRRGRLRSVLAVVVLGAVLLAALSGMLGGGASLQIEMQGTGVTGELSYDPIVRSGNWYETQVTIRAAAPIEDLTIAFDEAIWSRMSIDTLVPDAESAEALDGKYSFHFGPVKPGETFRLKVDGQIQPGLPRRQTGMITVTDEGVDPARPLIAMPSALTVLP